MGKMFTIKASEAHGRRLDPEYHHALRRTRIRSTYPSAKLLSLSYFRTGGTPSTAHPEYWNGSIPWVSAKDFKAFRFEDSEDHVTELAVAESTTCYVNRPAVLMVSRSGILQHTLPVMVTHKPTTINQDIKAFFPDDRVSVDYLGAFFDVFGSRLLPLVCKSGATVQSLNTEQLMDLSIPLPPLSDQRKIVAELDAAYAAKRAADEKATKLLASIDDMVLKELGIAKLPKPDTSLSSRIFTVPASEIYNGRLDAYYYKGNFKELNKKLSCCNCVPFGRLITEIYNGIDCRDYKESGVPYLKVANVKPGEFDFDDLKYIDSQEVGAKDSALRAGRMLLTRKGTFGNAIALSEDYDYAISSEVFCLSIKNELVDVHYLETFVNSSIGRMLCDKYKIGTIMGSLSQEAVKALPIPLPDAKVQHRIASRASSIRTEARKLKADATAALDAAKRKIEMQVMK